LVLVLCGCPGVTRPIERPIAHLVQVDITRGVGGKAAAEMRFDLSNPNEGALSLSAVDWQLELEDATPIRGRTRDIATLPARASKSVDVALEIHDQVAAVLLSRIDSGASFYRISGVMHFLGTVGDVAVQFDQTGDLADVVPSKR
jgi:LEA14-like dessication related protein